MDSKTLRTYLVEHVVNVWAEWNQFSVVTESKIINELTRLLNDTFSFTVFIIAINEYKYEIHFSDEDHEMYIIKFSINVKN